MSDQDKFSTLAPAAKGLGSPSGSASDGYSVHIKGFKDMPKKTQEALGRMFRCIINKLESEKPKKPNL